MAERTQVELPPGIGREFEVFLNGVRQVEGRDFRRESGSLVFDRPLTREGRLGFWRWLSLFLGVAGTYRQNDTVDVVYEVGPARRRDGTSARAGRELTQAEDDCSRAEVGHEVQQVQDERDRERLRRRHAVGRERDERRRLE